MNKESFLEIINNSPNSRGKYDFAIKTFIKSGEYATKIETKSTSIGSIAAATRSAIAKNLEWKDKVGVRQVKDKGVFLYRKDQ